MSHHPPSITATRTEHYPNTLLRKNLVRCVETGRLLVLTRLWHATDYDAVSVYLFQSKGVVYKPGAGRIESIDGKPYNLARLVYRRLALPKSMPRDEQLVAGESLAALAALEIEGGVVFHKDSRFGKGEVK